MNSAMGLPWPAVGPAGDHTGGRRREESGDVNSNPAKQEWHKAGSKDTWTKNDGTTLTRGCLIQSSGEDVVTTTLGAVLIIVNSL